MRHLTWQSGTRSAAEGKDLAAVASRLSDEDLAFWVRRFAGLPAPSELAILEAEADRRGADFLAGPLFRRSGHGDGSCTRRRRRCRLDEPRALHPPPYHTRPEAQTKE